MRNLVLQSWKKLHYHNVFGNQTWQGDDLPSMGRTHKVIWHFNDVVFSDHVSNWNRYTSCPTMHMSTTFGRILSFLEGILPIKSYYPSIAWSCCIMWHIIFIIYQFPLNKPCSPSMTKRQQLTVKRSNL